MKNSFKKYDRYRTKIPIMKDYGRKTDSSGKGYRPGPGGHRWRATYLSWIFTALFGGNIRFIVKMQFKTLIKVKALYFS